jgi:hypothetical protein
LSGRSVRRPDPLAEVLLPLDLVLLELVDEEQLVPPLEPLVDRRFGRRPGPTG